MSQSRFSSEQPGFSPAESARWVFVLIALLCLTAPVAAQRFAGRVLEVTDGDTVIVARGRGQVTVRLFGIDAPEGTQPYGAESAAALSRLVMGKVIDVDMKDVDQYGRLVATVSVGGADVNEALVRAGAAWHYAQYSDSAALAAAERDARASRRGLWQSASPQAPWLFRSAGQRPATLLNAPVPTTGPFHGNRESKVLHAPGCQHYNCKNCTVPFATVAQAQAAGFRVHEQCVKGAFNPLENCKPRDGAHGRRRAMTHPVTPIRHTCSVGMWRADVLANRAATMRSSIRILVDKNQWQHREIPQPGRHRVP